MERRERERERKKTIIRRRVSDAHREKERLRGGETGEMSVINNKRESKKESDQRDKMMVKKEKARAQENWLNTAKSESKKEQGKTD